MTRIRVISSNTWDFNLTLQISQEFSLKTQLHEAQLAKAKVEKAEITTDFNAERLQLNKSLIEAKQQIDLLISREDNLKEQVDLYAAQYNAMEKGYLLY